MLISTVEEVIGVREVVPPTRKARSTRLGGESADRWDLCESSDSFLPHMHTHR